LSEAKPGVVDSPDAAPRQGCEDSFRRSFPHPRFAHPLPEEAVSKCPDAAVNDR